jgi:hypothetical protein
MIDKFSSGTNFRKFALYTPNENGVQSINCDFFDGSGNSKQVRYTTTVLNTLFFVFATVDSNNTTLYVNGTQVNQTTGITLNPNPQSSEFAVGARVNTAYNGYFKGNIYQFQIYNRALTAQEILQNYNAQKSRFGLT